MYIEYDIIIFYGVVFTYEELKNINDEEIIDVGIKINFEFPHGLKSIWEEMGNPVISPHYSSRSDECLYGIGKKFKKRNLIWNRCFGCSIDSQEIYNWYDECEIENVKNEIKEFCEKNNLNYIEPKIIIMPSVW
jgi:hypothetical protein